MSITIESQNIIIIGLQQKIVDLSEKLSECYAEIKSLKDRLNKNSRNSSKSPSTDGLSKPSAPLSLRPKSDKKVWRTIGACRLDFRADRPS